MARTNHKTESGVMAVRLDRATIAQAESRARTKGLSKSDYLASLIKKDLADGPGIGQGLAKRIQARADEKGLSRADYLADLVDKDLARAESRWSTSWLNPYTWKKPRKRHKRRKPKYDLAQGIIDGFQPLLRGYRPPKGKTNLADEDPETLADAGTTTTARDSQQAMTR